MADWDDVRFVLALARNGSIRKASITLGVNHTTVSRRISSLEKRLSAKLFEKTPAGYKLTASGEIISSAAEQMEKLLISSERRIEGADTLLVGEVHIHIPDIFEQWVNKKLSKLLKANPRLSLHVSASLNVADLARREADVALRFSQSPPDDMVGRKICTFPVAIYAGIEFEYEPSNSLSDYPWVRWPTTFVNTPPEQAVEKLAGKLTQAVYANTYYSHTELIRNGAGIGMLSTWFADIDSRLKRISPDIIEGAMDLWILTHPDLRGVRRVKAVTDALREIFEERGHASES